MTTAIPNKLVDFHPPSAIPPMERVWTDRPFATQLLPPVHWPATTIKRAVCLCGRVQDRRYRFCHNLAASWLSDSILVVNVLSEMEAVHYSLGRDRRMIKYHWLLVKIFRSITKDSSIAINLLTLYKVEHVRVDISIVGIVNSSTEWRVTWSWLHRRFASFLLHEKASLNDFSYTANLP